MNWSQFRIAVFSISRFLQVLAKLRPKKSMHYFLSIIQVHECHFCTVHLQCIIYYFLCIYFSMYFGLRNIFGWFVKDFLIMDPMIYVSILLVHKQAISQTEKNNTCSSTIHKRVFFYRFHLENWWIKKLRFILE